jgi:hypothetical protein
MSSQFLNLLFHAALAANSPLPCASIATQDYITLAYCLGVAPIPDKCALNECGNDKCEIIFRGCENPMELNLKKTVKAMLPLEDIEAYMRSKKWIIDANGYRSPNAEINMSVQSGAQMLIDALSYYERRDSYDIYNDILAVGRNK